MQHVAKNVCVRVCVSTREQSTIHDFCLDARFRKHHRIYLGFISPTNVANDLAETISVRKPNTVTNTSGKKLPGLSVAAAASRVFGIPSNHRQDSDSIIRDEEIASFAEKRDARYPPLRIAVIPRHTLENAAQHLLETASKRDAAHGVEQEVDAEICVVQQHEELLQAPERLRRVLSRQGEEEHAQANHVTVTKCATRLVMQFSCKLDYYRERSPRLSVRPVEFHFRKLF